MKKKVIFFLLLLVTLASFFIPVTQQKTIVIKSPFLRVFSLLTRPENWERWRPDLSKNILADSSKIAIHKDSNFFSITYDPIKIDVKLQGNTFAIDDKEGDKTASYSYEVVPVPDKRPGQTLVAVEKTTSAFKYLVGRFSADPFSDTHASDLKKFMETDSLLYGFRVFKTKVPETFLVVVQNKVLKNAEFTEAARLLATLQQYVKTHNVRKIQPLIAQFSPTQKDTVQVRVGFYIDKEIKSDKVVTFNRMPKGGPLYAVRFSGKFNKRQQAYNALSDYYADHLYQSAIQPFEMYLDNKLPVSDTSHVKIQVNFSGFF
jgi:effector-binding domain-containing protein